MQTVAGVALVGSDLSQRVRLAPVEDLEDHRIDPVVDAGSFDRGEDTIQDEERYMACQGNRGQVGILEGQIAD